jgi:hypothetical protein
MPKLRVVQGDVYRPRGYYRCNGPNLAPGLPLWVQNGPDPGKSG